MKTKSFSAENCRNFFREPEIPVSDGKSLPRRIQLFG
jgi:hypothetical protein